MPEKSWKAHERRTASKLGGERVVCSGVKGEGDVEHPTFFIECKFRKAFTGKKWYDKAKKQAKKVNKIPIVVIREKNKKGEFVLISLDDFAKVARIPHKQK